jgi:hypothetical protein
MSQTDRTSDFMEGPFHTVSHYEGPDDVLQDAKLSSAEKRMILSSWASDMYAVESQPALRKIPGIPHELPLAEILAALKQLDDDTDPPPRGGMAMRVPQFNVIDCVASRPAVPSGTAVNYQRMKASRIPYVSRWTREANVRRYRRLLTTQLTDLERNFVERRLAEELRAIERDTNSDVRRFRRLAFARPEGGAL